MPNKFEYTILEMIENAIKNAKFAPVILKGNPGGYTGQLPQKLVGYDNVEASTLATATSGSLLDNLNHIRYRIANISGVAGSGGGATTFLGLTDAPHTYSGAIGKSVIVNPAGNGLIFSGIVASSGGASTFLGLTDAPHTYSGMIGKSVIVNPAGTGLTFSTVSGIFPTLDPNRMVVTSVSGSIITVPWMAIDQSDRRVIIGRDENTVPILGGTALHIWDDSGHTAGEIFLGGYGVGTAGDWPANNFAGRLWGYRSRGTFNNPSGILVNDIILEIDGIATLSNGDNIFPAERSGGDGNIEHSTPVMIRLVADGNFTVAPDSRPTRIEFWTTPPVTSGVVKAMQVTASGQLDMLGHSIINTTSPWSVITTDQTATVNNGYICNKNSLLTITMPNTAPIGSFINITGMNAGLWKIAQPAGMSIHFGNLNTTSGVSGYMQSNLMYDSVQLVCNVANSGWIVVSSIGNITVA